VTQFEFPVDDKFTRTHNEFFRDAKRFQWSAGILGGIFLVVAVLLFILGGAAWATILGIVLVVMAVVCLAMVPVLPRQLGSPQSYYSNYELVPAVIAQVNPRDVVLMALVDTAVPDTGTSPTPALALRTVTSVPGITREVGERVPSMAVTGMRTLRNQGHWEEISPMPVAWGTPDRSVVTAAEAAIPDRQWARLEGLVDRFDEVNRTRRRLLEL
jgi:hypothetical protein